MFQSSHRRHNLLSLVLFAGLLFIYLAFPTRNYYYDGIFFARTIEESQRLSASLIHPNHLIYSPFGFLIYRAVRLAGFGFRAVHVLQAVNSIASVGSAVVIFAIAVNSFRSRYLAWCLTFLFAFSATWWKYSTDAGAYIISVFLLLLCFYQIVTLRKSRPFLTAVLFSIAVFFHQLAVLFYPVVMLGLLWLKRDQSRVRNAIQFGVTAFVIVFGSYSIFFYLASGTTDIARFVRWFTSYSPDASFSFDIVNNLKYTLRGHTRLFFGGRFGFLKDYVGGSLVVLIGLWMALVVVLIIRLLRSLRHWRIDRSVLRLDNFARLCVIWIVLYVGFLFFWLPQNTFYRLFYLPAIVLFIGWVISKLPVQPRKFRLALFVAVMAFANFLFSILPYSHIERNPPLALALDMQRVWPAGTVVYFAAENTDNNLFRYFNENTEWRPFVDRQQLEQQNTTFWLETTAIDRILEQPDGADWLNRHVNPKTRRELIDRAYRIRYYQIEGSRR